MAAFGMNLARGMEGGVGSRRPRKGNATRAGAVFALAAALTTGCQVTLFAGDYYKPEPGEVVFGEQLDPSRTMVSGPTTSTAMEGTVAYVGNLGRMVTGDIRLQLLVDGEELGDVGRTIAVDPPGFDSVWGEWDLDSFSEGPGEYTIRMSLGSELLAEGTLQLTSPQ